MPAAQRTRTRRRSGAAGSDSVAATQKLVAELIAENRRLRRENDRLRSGGGTRTSGRQPKSPAERALTVIQRQVQRALGGAVAPARGRRSASTATTRTRKPVSPEVRARRLEALAKARQVRAQKRAAAGS
jgi:hypothetical protein